MVIKLGKLLSDVEETKPVPTGEYSLRVSKIEVQPSKDGLGSNIVWEFDIFDDPDYEGRKITTWTSLPKPEDENEMTVTGISMEDFKLGMIKKILTALKANADIKQIDAAKVLGLTCKGFIKEDIYDDRPVNKISKFGPD